MTNNGGETSIEGNLKLFESDSQGHSDQVQPATDESKREVLQPGQETVVGSLGNTAARAIPGRDSGEQPGLTLNGTLDDEMDQPTFIELDDVQPYYRSAFMVVNQDKRREKPDNEGDVLQRNTVFYQQHQGSHNLSADLKNEAEKATNSSSYDSNGQTARNKSSSWYPGREMQGGLTTESQKYLHGSFYYGSPQPLPHTVRVRKEVAPDFAAPLQNVQQIRHQYYENAPTSHIGFLDIYKNSKILPPRKGLVVNRNRPIQFFSPEPTANGEEDYDGFVEEGMEQFGWFQNEPGATAGRDRNVLRRHHSVNSFDSRGTNVAVYRAEDQVLMNPTPPESLTLMQQKAWFSAPPKPKLTRCLSIGTMPSSRKWPIRQSLDTILRSDVSSTTSSIDEDDYSGCAESGGIDLYQLTVHLLSNPGPEFRQLHSILSPLIALTRASAPLFYFVQTAYKPPPLKASEQDPKVQIPSLAFVLFCSEKRGLGRMEAAHRYLNTSPWQLHHCKSKPRSNQKTISSNQLNFYYLAPDQPLWAVRQTHSRDTFRFQIVVCHESWEDMIAFYTILLGRSAKYRNDTFCYFVVCRSDEHELETQLALKRLTVDETPIKLPSTLLQFRVEEPGQLVPLLPHRCTPISESRWQTKDCDGNTVLLQVSTKTQFISPGAAGMPKDNFTTYH